MYLVQYNGSYNFRYTDLDKIYQMIGGSLEDVNVYRGAKAILILEDI